MNESLLSALVVVLLVVSVAALVVGVLALRRTTHDARRISRRNPAHVPADLEGLLSLYEPGATLVPQPDVVVEGIDGIRDAVQGVVDGKINAVIESNPRFGPLAFSTAADFYAGEAIPEDIIIEDDEYTPENAEAELPNAF